jgi:hypothetical protein
MYYAIIRQVPSASPNPKASPNTSPAEYTGVVYEDLTKSTIDNHKEQGFYIEPMVDMLEPINKKEIAEFEMKKAQKEMEVKMAEAMEKMPGFDDDKMAKEMVDMPDMPTEDPFQMNEMFNIPSPELLVDDIEPMPVYPSVEKENAANAIIFYIREEKKKYNTSDFTYTHSVEGECTFSASSDAINAVYTMCTGLADGDSIPTQHGQWKGYLADGTAKMIDFTVSEFKSMATTFFNRNDVNFHNEELHITNIMNMVTDDSSTIVDILNYDYSTGWNGTTTHSANVWF